MLSSFVFARWFSCKSWLEPVCCKKRQKSYNKLCVSTESILPWFWFIVQDTTIVHASMEKRKADDENEGKSKKKAKLGKI